MSMHVCIVSEQVLANLIPALMERPANVWLVSSEEMSRRGLDQRLRKQLEQAGWPITVTLRNHAPQAEVPKIQEYATTIATQIDSEHPGGAITLNVTGGTKLMAMVFAEVFAKLIGPRCRIIYTDTLHRRIEHLPPQQGPALPPSKMTNVLDMEGYLAAQGFRVKSVASRSADWQKAAAERKAAAKFLGREAESLGPFIGTLNALAGKALERDPSGDGEILVNPVQSFDRLTSPTWRRALEEIRKCNLIGWEQGRNEIAFKDVPRTRFLRGGWLEEYAWHIVHDERPHDAGLGVTVSLRASAETENEFDVLAVHCNQMLFIECKTLRFADNGTDSDTAYKLDSLGRQARGVFGETWLLSGRSPTPSLLERARANRIRLIGPDGLRNLRADVQAWMRGRDAA